MLSLVPFAHSQRLMQYHFNHVFFMHCAFDREVVDARHKAWLGEVLNGNLGDQDWEWLSLCKLPVANTLTVDFAIIAVSWTTPRKLTTSRASISCQSRRPQVWAGNEVSPLEVTLI